jgi:hypothetical protein
MKCRHNELRVVSELNLDEKVSSCDAEQSLPTTTQLSEGEELVAQAIDARDGDLRDPYHPGEGCT